MSWTHAAAFAGGYAVALLGFVVAACMQRPKVRRVRLDGREGVEVAIDYDREIETYLWAERVGRN